MMSWIATSCLLAKTNLVACGVVFACASCPVIASEARQSTQQVLQVGPQREIKTLAAAASLAQAGSTIEVDSGEYVGDVAVWTQKMI